MSDFYLALALPLPPPPLSDSFRALVDSLYEKGQRQSNQHPHHFQYPTMPPESRSRYAYPRYIHACMHQPTQHNTSTPPAANKPSSRFCLTRQDPSNPTCMFSMYHVPHKFVITQPPPILTLKDIGGEHSRSRSGSSIDVYPIEGVDGATIGEGDGHIAVHAMRVERAHHG
ncbi:uncharacterized protein BO80DRAFT_250417 [Aspergillus ibericus CBS 121593]|uniref:Uncharacterized protein n=1 Tax=Aspergillus ibericus CBS 121593 TaxID=1448316 RepID=A0A395GJV2_9EURO|nr:hypothetical protein BO80DRAFT_250417 [Aspergillus ibericus CBS 121593]RAK95739.1 hypothetical protein BO80DRAFT_250417 [Aspergillus ibericus CBS 121593]